MRSTRLCVMMTIFVYCFYIHSEGHFDTRQVVHFVSHFVYEFVEFVIDLGHGQNPILSSSFLDMDRSLFFRTREVVKKTWLSLIIKLKLVWLWRSMIHPLGTFPWLSLSVTHAKTRKKGLILIILSTYHSDHIVNLDIHREASVLGNDIPEESSHLCFLHTACLTNVNGSVGLILTKVSSMRISIPLDL